MLTDNLVLVLMGFIGIIILILVLWQPYLGIVFTITTLPIIDLLPSIPLFSSITPLLGLVTLVGYLFQFKKGPQNWKKGLNVVYLLGIVYVFWVFLSNPNAALLSGDRNWLFTFVQLWVMMLLSGELLKTPEKQKTAILVFAMAAMVSALFAIIRGDIAEDALNSARIAGLATNANQAARYFVVAMVFFYYLRIKTEAPFAKLLFLIGIIVTFLGVFFTVSRSGILLLFGAVGLIFILRSKIKQRVGLPTGYLYEMETFEDVLDAFHKQMEFFLRWHAIINNNAEYVLREVLPLPVVSATMEGCMEKGKDVMYGGAKYNGTGIPGIGIGNIADSLFMIKHLCFDTKKCTTRELYDALLNNWEGYEELQQYIKGSELHYGNGNPEVDKWAAWAAEKYAEIVTSFTGPRGRYTAALFPVTAHVMFGMMTAATPDGRNAGVPLSDGISPVQQMDKNGPTAIIRSVATLKQDAFANGTLLNMKFSPSCLRGEDGIKKLSQLIQTYFNLGGMEVQINVHSADTLREAQKNPDEYRDLVVRIAGFSAYFVELHVTSQNELISRTVLEM